MAKQTAVGVPSVDEQHEQLVALFDEFDGCVKSGATLEVVQNVVERAIACANAHFEHEEELIAQTNYPEAEKHKLLHRHMRMEFTTLAGKMLTEFCRDSVALEQLATMRAMLDDHIAGPDQELGAHLRAAGAR